MGFYLNMGFNPHEYGTFILIETYMSVLSIVIAFLEESNFVPQYKEHSVTCKCPFQPFLHTRQNYMIDNSYYNMLSPPWDSTGVSVSVPLHV